GGGNIWVTSEQAGQFSGDWQIFSRAADIYAHEAPSYLDIRCVKKKKRTLRWLRVYLLGGVRQPNGLSLLRGIKLCRLSHFSVTRCALWYCKGWRASFEVVNQAEDGSEDLLADLTAIVYSFCARLYGQRQAKHKTEVIVRELEAKGDAEEKVDATG
ncbi:MAG: hypothetical protein ACXWQR_11775, partial [Ktedonobacterales bacterium]